MAKKARVVIELEENFDDDIDDETLADMDYDEFDDIRGFAEYVWEKRMEALGREDDVTAINVYKIDD